MNKIILALKSRTIWVLVVFFLINGVSGIREAIPPEYLTYIDGFLGLMAAYFKISPSQKYDKGE